MKHLGQNIRSLRESRKLTLKQVSSNTGIDVATLSRIENGKMTGTIQSHMSIAKVLGVRLPDLYEKAIEGERKPATANLSGIFSHSGGSLSELLTSGVLQKRMMPVRLRLRAKAKTVTEELPLGTDRFTYVLSGKVDLVIKNVSHPLSEGESLYFNASLPHYFSNLTKTPSTCLIVTTPAVL